MSNIVNPMINLYDIRIVWKLHGIISDQNAISSLETIYQMAFCAFKHAIKTCNYVFVHTWPDVWHVQVLQES